VQETGRDPVTSEALGEDDLLELTSSQAVKPRPTPATSIPGLLSLFQNVSGFTLGSQAKQAGRHCKQQRK
jgi:hypothetical protein